MNVVRLTAWSRYLIYFILAVLPLERIPSLELSSPTHITVRLSQVAGVLLIALTLPMMWSQRRQLLKLPFLPLILFWVVCIVSALASGHHLRSFSVTAFTIFVGLLAWSIALNFERDKLATYLRIILLSAAITCGFGFYQFFGDLFGLQPNMTGLRPQYTSSVFGFPRIQSTGLEPLYYDDFLLIPIGICLAIVANLDRKLFRRTLPLLVLYLTIIIMNISRGALLAALVMAVIATGYCISRRKWARLSAIFGVYVMSGIIAIGFVSLGSHIASARNAQTSHAVSNLTSHATNISTGESSEFRSLSRHTATTIFQQNVLLGVGPGNFGYAAHSVSPLIFSDTNAIVNNEPLELLSETGILGGLAFVFFAVGLLLWSSKRMKSLDQVDRTISAGLLLALFGIAIQYQTFSTLYITHIWVAIGVLIGLLSISSPSKRSKV
jgi:hypothetical protein